MCIRDPNIVECGSRQYKVGNECFDVSALCGAFDEEDGSCLTCSKPDEYDLVGGACVLKPVTPPGPTDPNNPTDPFNPTNPTDPNNPNSPIFPCLGNEYRDFSGNCRPIPANCVSFNSFTERCDQCSWGLVPAQFGSGCTPLVCLNGKVMAVDGRRCIDMPPNCAKYDSNIG